MIESNDGTEGDGLYVCVCCGQKTDSVMVIHKMDLCPECATDLIAEAGCPCGGCGG